MEACPICHRSDGMHKSKVLYDKLVCKKCANSFANRRQGAFIIDIVLYRLVMFGVGMAVGLALASMDTVLTQSQWMTISYALAISVYMIFAMKDGLGGKSPGKAILGVEVRDKGTYEKIGFLASFKRNICLIVPFLPLVAAFQLIKGHRLGDGWGNTKVVWSKYADSPVFTGLAIPNQTVGFSDASPANPNAQYKDSDNPFQAPQS